MEFVNEEIIDTIFLWGKSSCIFLLIVSFIVSYEKICYEILLLIPSPFLRVVWVDRPISIPIRSDHKESFPPKSFMLPQLRHFKHILSDREVIIQNTQKYIVISLLSYFDISMMSNQEGKKNGPPGLNNINQLTARQFYTNIDFLIAKNYSLEVLILRRKRLHWFKV